MLPPGSQPKWHLCSLGRLQLVETDCQHTDRGCDHDVASVFMPDGFTHFEDQLVGMSVL
jgi:hypothetical protein